MLYASMFGYFWLPCPLCNEMFGGHEKKGSLYTSLSSGVCVCKNCKPLADKKNSENIEKFKSDFFGVA